MGRSDSYTVGEGAIRHLRCHSWRGQGITTAQNDRSKSGARSRAMAANALHLLTYARAMIEPDGECRAAWMGVGSVV